jgi:hypothetical protein
VGVTVGVAVGADVGTRVGTAVGLGVGSHTVALIRIKPLRHSHVYEFETAGSAGTQYVDAVSHICVPPVQWCRVGAMVGAAIGAAVGSRVGLDVGACVGSVVGNAVGRAVGARVGVAVGAFVGLLVGAAVGADVVRGSHSRCVNPLSARPLADPVQSAARVPAAHKLTAALTPLHEATDPRAGGIGALMLCSHVPLVVTVEPTLQSKFETSMPELTSRVHRTTVCTCALTPSRQPSVAYAPEVHIPVTTYPVGQLLSNDDPVEPSTLIGLTSGISPGNRAHPSVPIQDMCRESVWQRACGSELGM